jgi:serine protease AprX
VITVGAVSDGDAIADFSSRGPTLDGRAKPDIVLPGVSITAARASNTSLGTPADEWYTTEQGTSMAAPHAAGVAALMLAANPALTPGDIKRIMLSATQSLGVDVNLQGSGRLLAARAVELARGQTPGPGVEPAPPPRPAPAPQPEGCFAPVARLFGRNS